MWYVSYHLWYRNRLFVARATCGTLDWSPPLDRARGERVGSLVRKLPFDMPKARVRVWARPSPRKSRKFNEICENCPAWYGPGQFLAAPYHMWYASYHMWYAVRRVVCSPALCVLCAGCCQISVSLCRTRDGLLRFSGHVCSSRAYSPRYYVKALEDGLRPKCTTCCPGHKWYASYHLWYGTIWCVVGVASVATTAR